MKTNSKDHFSRAVFLDRDGPIILDTGHVRDHERVRLSEGAAEGIKLLKEHGFKVIVISNQAGVAKGIITTEQARAVHEKVISLLLSKGVEIDDVYYCFHHPDDACLCRKPKTQHVHDAAAKHGIDLARSFFVGDKEIDVQTGRNTHPDMKTFLTTASATLKHAAEWIIHQDRI
ncbi:MAG: HAD family hydrolase [Patescibacteria group bacterium]